MRLRRPPALSLRHWLCPLAALLGARAAQSQSPFRASASIDAGAATIRQTNQPDLTAPTLGGELRGDGRRVAMRLLGNAALASSDRWSAQGDLALSWIALSSAHSALEIGAQGAALRFSGTEAAGSATAIARQHLTLGTLAGLGGGGWIGAGGGVVSRDGGHRAALGTAEAGGWLGDTRARASLTLAWQRARLDTLPIYVRGVKLAAPPAIEALDATLATEWHTSRADLGAIAALRHAPRQSDAVLGSAYATGAWWVVPRAAVTGSLGALAADPLRGFPMRRVATLGARVRFGATRVRTPAPMPTPSAEVIAARDASPPRVLRVLRVLRVRAPGATHVEVRADFTGWRAVALAHVGDAWELTLPTSVGAGTARIALRIDAGAWRAPANVPSIDDEFGERTGLLVIP